MPSVTQRIATALEQIASALSEKRFGETKSQTPIGVIFQNADKNILKVVSGEKVREARAFMQCIQSSLQEDKAMQPNVAADISRKYNQRAFAEFAAKHIELSLMGGLLDLEHHQSATEVAWNISDALHLSGLWDE